MAENSRHRQYDIKKLHHCHPIYTHDETDLCVGCRDDCASDETVTPGEGSGASGVNAGRPSGAKVGRRLGGVADEECWERRWECMQCTGGGR